MDRKAKECCFGRPLWIHFSLWAWYEDCEMSVMLSSKGFSYISFYLFLGLWFVMASPDISPTAFCSIFGFEMLVLFSSWMKDSYQSHIYDSHVTFSFWCKVLCDCIYIIYIPCARFNWMYFNVSYLAHCIVHSTHYIWSMGKLCQLFLNLTKWLFA